MHRWAEAMGIFRTFLRGKSWGFNEEKYDFNGGKSWKISMGRWGKSSKMLDLNGIYVMFIWELYISVLCGMHMGNI